MGRLERIQPSWRGEYEITDAIDVLVKDQKSVQPYTLVGWWIDAGKPDAIITANQLVMSEMPYTPAPVPEGIDARSQVDRALSWVKMSRLSTAWCADPSSLGIASRSLIATWDLIPLWGTR
ncbi:MAG UNVERIFIED_CONTAM: hypothetical protein LVT10_18535 [Anaerolineae bacterium]